MTYPNGGVYEGDFLCGKRHGKGNLIYPNLFTPRNDVEDVGDESCIETSIHIIYYN